MKILNATNKKTARFYFLSATVSLGLFLTLGWGLYVAISNISSTLPCVFSPSACERGAPLTGLIINTPFILGSILLSIGIFSGEKLSLMKVIIYTILVSIVIFYSSVYATGFLNIALHGIK